MEPKAKAADSSLMGKPILHKQMADLLGTPSNYFSAGFSDDDIFVWEVMIYGQDNTPYEGGTFKARLDFPHDFPFNPPTMTFVSEMFHPNVYPDGKVCISILHPPVEDKFNTQEPATLRWRPVMGVETIIASVLMMLNEPNIESPANVDAGKMYRDDRPQFNARVRKLARKSAEC